MRLSLLPILAALSPAAHGLLSGRDLHARDRTGFPDQWAGANSFFLHSYTQPEQTEIVTNLANAGIKVIRVFISTFNAGMKQSDSNVLSNNVYMQDLEYTNLGPNYNDQNLVALDWLMQLVASKGMKLILCAHDRWMLDGTWGTSDAYAHRWPNITNFYYDTAAQQTFDARLAHIATHVNPLMGNRQWKDIPEAIYAFEIQNEAQGFGLQSVAPFNYDWTCGRATNLRAVIGNSLIYISNGGGVNGDWSNLQSYYNYAALDVVAIHDYDVSDAQNAMKNGLAAHPNKIVILEEFGAQGSSANKAAAIQAVGNAANSLRVSWMVWEAVKPGQVTKDYEFYVGDTEAWAALAAAAQLTQACQNGQCPVIQNVGCYLDSSNRAMPNAVTLPVQAVASVEICLSQCMASGFKYSGLENSKECYCSNAIPSLAASNCNMGCAGNSKQLCGGAWALSVYTLTSSTPSLFPVGCFADSSNRVMTFLYRRDGITADQCLSDCHNSNYAFAGVENRNECYCGNSVPFATSSNCNAPCVGNLNQLCGGPWALSVYSDTANAPAPSSIGCYLDSANRVMTQLYQRNSVTASQCLSDCLTAKYTYSGLENGNECYCSNSIPSTFSSNCNVPCAGTSQQICGGSWALSVYAYGVPTPPSSIGCYQDNANRVMKSLYTQDSKLTVVQCLNDCSKAGYSIAGLEFGQECYCSNLLPSTISTNCNMGCTGNPNQVCGGSYALSLYSYKQITPPPIGCYQDNANRVMLYLYSQSQLTVDQCRQDCSNAGFAYAGLEYYRECYCSNALPSTAATNCNTPCAGNQNQLCGGPYALSVYLTH